MLDELIEVGVDPMYAACLCFPHPASAEEPLGPPCFSITAGTTLAAVIAKINLLRALAASTPEAVATSNSRPILTRLRSRMPVRTFAA